MKIISLGAGVQSTTMYLMSCCGEIDRADAAIFADTGWEPKVVYAHLEKLKALNEIPIHVVTTGNLRTDVFNVFSGSRAASMPLFTKDSEGKVSSLRRQCTREYKIAPIHKMVRELGASKKAPAEIWIGISADEVNRMKESFVQYIYHRWPLIEKRMDRAQCRDWLASKGWPAVPKSSCIGCPFHDNEYWRRMKMESKDEWADAVEFDRAIRQVPRLRDQTFIHRYAVPLDQVELEHEDQLDLFLEECEGMCGV